MTTPTDTALARFQQGFSCSQSVFSSLAPQLGLDEQTALKLAAPFGGGIARRGHICGAVTGALLAVGLKHGAITPEVKEETYKAAREFIRCFEDKHASIICRELINCDISTPEGLQSAREKGVFTSICPLLVRDAVEIFITFV